MTNNKEEAYYFDQSFAMVIDPAFEALSYWRVVIQADETHGLKRTIVEFVIYVV